MMKRIFTSISLICVMCNAQAQKAAFRYHGELLEDEATATIYAEPNENFPDELECNTNPHSNPSNGLVLQNLTSTDLHGSAVMDIEKNTLKPNRIQWCMGSSCMLLTEASTDKAFNVPANGICQVQFDCDPTEKGELLATLIVLAGMESHTINILFVNNPDHIGRLKANKNVTDYYTLDGRRVATQPLGVSLARYADGSVRKVIKK